MINIRSLVQKILTAELYILILPPEQTIIYKINMKKYLFFAGLLSSLLLSCGKDKEDPQPKPKTSPNNLPVAYADSTALTEGSSTTIFPLANDTDEDNNSLIISSAKILSGNGSAVVTADKKSINFNTFAGDTGTTVIEYSVSDGKGGSATAKITVTVKKKQIVYQNFIRFNNTTYVPTSGYWVQAGFFGYDELTVSQDINTDNFESRFVEVRISSMFDYTETGKTYTFTTTTAKDHIQKGEAYVEYTDQSGGLMKSISYPALEGQTIRLTVTNKHATGINGYLEIDDISLSNGNKLSAKSNR
jgi:hypothetical protein